MTVRRHVPRVVQVVVACVALLVAVLVGIGLARTRVVHGWLGDPDPAAGRAAVLRDGRLVDENRALRDERDRLLASGDTTDSRGVMERSTIRELGAQIARLEADNTRLKEDAAFFEAATADRPPAAAVDAASGIAIRRFQVTQDKSARIARYRLLLTQDSRANRDFAGDLQLAIGLQQGGRVVNVVLPARDAAAAGPIARPVNDAANFAFSFRSYKRLDGSFELPAGAVLRSVQARILERGAVRVQQAVTLD